MLDLKFIRENVEAVRQGIEAKRVSVDLDLLLSLDEERRELIQKTEKLKAERNRVSGDIGRLKKEGRDNQPAVLRMREVAREIKGLDDSLKEVQGKIHTILITVPNLPHPSVPAGPDASANQIVKTVGGIPSFDFEVRPHWDIGPELGILDFEGGSMLSGSNFVAYAGGGARLQRALIDFMIDLHVEKHGYREVWVPSIVKREMMFGTGQLPKLEEDMYHVEKDDLFLIPTAEVPVTNLVRDRILKPDELPLYLTAYTPCFRREAGSYGADTRGLMRVHQFDKVEMVKFVDPETSCEEHESLLANAEEVLQLLELPYRVVLLSTGDLSFSASKCYDIEVYAPGIDKWLEVSSCSNFEDFQARRMNIRFRRAHGEKVEFVHTLNGSGLALPRTVIAILEHYQTGEGSVMVPPVLKKYMGSETIR